MRNKLKKGQENKQSLAQAGGLTLVSGVGDLITESDGVVKYSSAGISLPLLLP